MERVREKTEQNTVSVRKTSNGYYEARISLKIGGGKSNRFQKGGKEQELAVLHLLEAIEQFIDSIIQNGLMTFKINTNLPHLLIKSVNNLQIQMPEVTEKTLLIVNKINSFNSKFDNVITTYNNIVPFPTLKSNIDTTANIPLVNNYYNNQALESAIQNYKNDNLDIFEDFAYEWIAYKFSQCEKTVDNPVARSRKTMESYHKIMTLNILPFLKKNKIIYFRQITEDILKALIQNVNGNYTKRHTYIVLSMIFQYAMKKHKITENPLEHIDKPKIPKKKETEKRAIIPFDRIELWCEKLEEEAKISGDMYLLFIVLLMVGLRPEERMSDYVGHL